MLTVNDIISKARFPLADTSSDDIRWSDERLISLLNDCQLDLAYTTDIFDTIGFVPIVIGQTVYDLSEDVVKLNRVEYNSEPLAFSTYHEMDTGSPSASTQNNNDNLSTTERYRLGYDYQSGRYWQQAEGDTPTRIVYDGRKAGSFRLFPIPTAGVEESIQYEPSPYGMVVNVAYEDAEIDISTEPSTPCLKVFYSLMPTHIPLEKASLTMKLDDVITRPMIAMIVEYITGTALKDNQDANSVQIGNQKLAYYYSLKEEFEATEAMGNVERVRTIHNRVGVPSGGGQYGTR